MAHCGPHLPDPLSVMPIRAHRMRCGWLSLTGAGRSAHSDCFTIISAVWVKVSGRAQFSPPTGYIRDWGEALMFVGVPHAGNGHLQTPMGDNDDLPAEWELHLSDKPV